MNRHAYKVIFSKRLGRKVVVGENVASEGKQASPGIRETSLAVDASAGCSLRQAAYAVKWVWMPFGLAVLALWQNVAVAGVVPDATAPASQRPAVVAASNGTPVLNITAPNAQGLSVNKLSELDVGNFIFNNSQQDGVSKLGGYLLKNGNLGQGAPASAILAEVNGSKAARLNGALEVYGQKANLFIATPNELVVDGVSTVNVGGMGLIAGGLNGNSELMARQGKLSIGAGGLNTNGLSWLDLVAGKIMLAGAVTRNDGGASDVRVIAGQNDYDVSTRGYRYAGDGNEVPQVLIDGTAAGSIFGDRVQLVVTGAGSGVRQPGQILAKGDVHISADGSLQLAAVEAGRDMQLKAGKMTNEAGTTLAAGGKLDVAVRELLENHGQMTGGTSVELSAGALKNGAQGRIGSRGTLNLEISGDLENAGAIAANRDLTVTARHMLLLAKDGAPAGSMKSDEGKVELTVSAGMELRDGASIVAGKSIAVGGRGDVVFGQGAELHAQDDIGVVVDGGIANTGSKLTAKHGILHLKGTTLTQGGAAQLVSGGDMVLDASADVVNSGGARLQALGGLSVHANGAIENRGDGTLMQAGGIVSLDAGGRFVNAGGAAVHGTSGGKISAASMSNIGPGSVLSSGGTLVLDIAGELMNQDGAVIDAGNALEVQAATLVNRGSEGKGNSLLHGAKIDLKIEGELSNVDGAYLVADGTMALAASHLLNSGAHIRSDDKAGSGSLRISGGLTNREGAALEAAGRLEVIAGAGDIVNDNARIKGATVKLTSDASLQNVSGALIESGKRTQSTGAVVVPNAADGDVSEPALEIQVGGDLVNSASRIVASDTVKLSAGGELRNIAGSAVEGADIDARAGNVLNEGAAMRAADRLQIVGTRDMINRSGGVMEADHIALQADTVRNSARIEGRDDVKLSERVFENSTGGQIVANRNLVVSTQAYTNSGKLHSNGDAALDMQAHDLHVTDAAALPQANGLLTLDVKNLDIDSEVALPGSATIHAAGSVSNNAALMVNGNLEVEATGDLVNRNEGLLSAGKDLSLKAKKIRNESGSEISAGGNVTLNADTVTNEGKAVIEAGKDVAIDARVLENQALVTGGAERDDSERQSAAHDDHHDARHEHYELDIDVPLFKSTQHITPGVIKAAGNLKLNQGANKGKYGEVRNLNGQMLAGGDVQIDGDLSNLSKEVLLRTSDYLDAPANVSLQVQSWTNINSQLDGKTGVSYKTLREFLQAMLGNLSNPGKQIGGIVGYNWYPSEVMKTLALIDKSPQLNALLNEVLLPDWRAQDFATLCKRWANFSDRQIQSLIGQLPAEIAAGGKFSHTGGSLTNGSAAVQEQRPVTVQVGEHKVDVELGQFSTKVNPETLPSVLSPLDSLADLLGNRRAYKINPPVLREPPPLQAVTVTPGGLTPPPVAVVPIYETRLQYIDQSKFFGSEEFFRQVNYNPGRAVSVLADNYTTNKLLNTQIERAVGGYFMRTYSLSDTALVKHLMDNAGKMAELGGMVVGQEPTAEQLARAEKAGLNFVWYVLKDVAGQTALVPQVYLTKATRQAGGARIGAADTVTVVADKGGVSNVNGAISGGNGVDITTSGKLLNASTGGVGAGIESDGAVKLKATGDIRVQGASVAGKEVTVATDGKLELASGMGSDGNGKHAVVDQAVIVAKDKVTLRSGGDTVIKASAVSGTNVLVDAGGKLTVQDVHVADSAAYEVNRKGDGGLGFSQKRDQSASAVAEGSHLQAAAEGGTLTLRAKGDVTLRGGTYAADRGEVTSTGGAVVTQTSQDVRHSVSKTLTEEFVIGVNGGVAGQGGEASYGTVSGGAKSTIKDGQYVATTAGDGKLNGGNAPLDELAGAHLGYSRSEVSETEFSLTNRNAQLNFGSQLAVSAAKQVDIGGADMAVSQESGKLTVHGAEVVSTKFEDIQKNTRDETKVFLGVSTEAHSSIADLANNSQESAQQARDGQAINGAAKAAQVASDVTNLLFNDTVGGSVNASLKIEQSHSESSTRAQKVNTLKGGTVEITSSKGDIRLKGVEIDANKAVLDSAGKLELTAAEKVSESHENSSMHQVTVGANAGVNAVFQSTSVGISAGYNGATEKTDSHSLEHSNTKISAKDVTLRSKGDAVLKGAVVQSDTTTVDIGGNLRVESVQDQSTMVHERGDWGVQVGMDVGASGQTGPAAARGDISVSVQAGYGKDWDNAKVTKEQSGITAKEKLEVKVGGDLALKGAVLASESGEGKVKVAGATKAETLQDVRNKDGGYAGVGVGITIGADEKVALSGVDIKAEVVDQAFYQASNQATIGVKNFSSGAVSGQLNRDIGQAKVVTDDRQIGGVAMSTTVAIDSIQEARDAIKDHREKRNRSATKDLATNILMQGAGPVVPNGVKQIRDREKNAGKAGDVSSATKSLATNSLVQAAGPVVPDGVKQVLGTENNAGKAGDVSSATKSLAINSLVQAAGPVVPGGVKQALGTENNTGKAGNVSSATKSLATNSLVQAAGPVVPGGVKQVLGTENNAGKAGDVSSATKSLAANSLLQGAGPALPDSVKQVKDSEKNAGKAGEVSSATKSLATTSLTPGAGPVVPKSVMQDGKIEKQGDRTAGDVAPAGRAESGSDAAREKKDGADNINGASPRSDTPGASSKAANAAGAVAATEDNSKVPALASKPAEQASDVPVAGDEKKAQGDMQSKPALPPKPVPK